MEKKLPLFTIVTFLVLLVCSLFANSGALGFTLTPPFTNKKQPIVYKDFWRRLRANFKLKHYTYEPSVRSQIIWFRKNQSFLRKILDNATPYLYYIVKQVEQRHLPGELALLPIVESAYNPLAFSNRGAAGLWQLMPGTATGFGVTQDWWYDGRRDISASTRAALDYLTYLQTFFNGDWLLAFAAYDSGEGRVQQSIQINASKGRSTRFWRLPLPHETETYVPRILALAEIIKHPKRYGIRLPNIKDAPYFTIVHVGSQINLAKAAKLADISVKKLFLLNPGFNRWATDPHGPHKLLIPLNKAAIFKKNLAKLPPDQRTTWQRYVVKKGDVLGKIAHQFKTTIILLKYVNRLSNNTIYPSQILYIPENAHTLGKHQLPKRLEKFNEKLKTKGPKKVIYTVKKGDDIYDVAKKYHMKPNQIRFWNHLQANQSLSSNKQLILWVPRREKLHKVVAGESLIRIAHHYNMKAKQLKQYNHLKRNLIRVGQELKIPDNGKL